LIRASLGLHKSIVIPAAAGNHCHQRENGSPPVRG
jgi:hypothetical protein